MKDVKYKYFDEIRSRDRFPRKIKKAILGIRMSSSALRRKLKVAIIDTQAKTMYQSPTLISGHNLFCPKCGCEDQSGTGNMTTYPEHWENFFCYRCKNKVAYIDNSPYTHALEFPEYNYSLEHY